MGTKKKKKGQLRRVQDLSPGEGRRWGPKAVISVPHYLGLPLGCSSTGCSVGFWKCYRMNLQERGLIRVPRAGESFLTDKT